MVVLVEAAGGGATSALGAPTEKVSDPLTGWPSSDTTRQTTTRVPGPTCSVRLTASSRPGDRRRRRDGTTLGVEHLDAVRHPADRLVEREPDLLRGRLEDGALGRVAADQRGVRARRGCRAQQQERRRRRASSEQPCRAERRPVTSGGAGARAPSPPSAAPIRLADEGRDVQASTALGSAAAPRAVPDGRVAGVDSAEDAVVAAAARGGEDERRRGQLERPPRPARRPGPRSRRPRPARTSGWSGTPGCRPPGRAAAARARGRRGSPSGSGVSVR